MSLKCTGQAHQLVFEGLSSYNKYVIMTSKTKNKPLFLDSKKTFSIGV
jgi:hypothetical protein